MIRINLLAVNRGAAARRGAVDVGRWVAVACSVILALTVSLIGWRFWTLRQASAQVAEDVAAVSQELQRLQPVLESVAALEAAQTRLAARVELIDRLRQGRAGPARMLDQVSRSLPDGLWLSRLRQTEDGVFVEGRATTLRGLSDFVTNLETSGHVKPPVAIVTSQTRETPQGDVVNFQLRAVFEVPIS